MTGQAKECHGCAYAAHRFKGSRPSLWCKRFKRITSVRCIDYIKKPDAIQQALQYIQRISIK